LLNDLLDLADDRHHHSKRHRPFAAGRLSIKFGLIAFIVLLIASFFGSTLLLSWQFTEVLVAYYILTLAYSLFLKRQMAVDVIALAMLYTIRIIAGAAAFGLALTFWVLAFSMFMFLSLALVKRYAELREARRKGHTEKTRGRGYYPDDLEMISSLGAASGYLAVMVLALYIHDQATIALYTQPQVIWLACPLLLFWITRVWMLTHRGQMHDDPVVFAVRDKVSLLVGVLFGLVFWIAA
jgi:4-hydroxybenzoate polyprenyltransferase